MEPWVAVLIGLLCLIIGSGLGIFVAYRTSFGGVKKRLEDSAKEVQKATDEANIIIKNAEVEGKKLLIEAKEKAGYEVEQVNKEAKERKVELKTLENTLLQREQYLAKRDETLNKKEEVLENKSEQLSIRVTGFKIKEDALLVKEGKLDAELERIAGLTKNEAKKEIIEQFKDKLNSELGYLIKLQEEELHAKEVELSQQILATAIEKYAQDVVTEKTITVVLLPNDEIKGKIIGREGRNIKTLEAKLGVDFIIDDTPEVIQISCHDPIKREVARITLEKLIKDGRIQPGRIEDTIVKATDEVTDSIREAGEEIIFKLGLSKVNRELQSILGKLKYRTSMGQNVLQHSYEVAVFSGLMAEELGLDVMLAKRAGLFHDIGKAVDHEKEGTHVELGEQIARKYGEHPTVINAILSHHGNIPADNPISLLVSAADTLSAARPGARNENLERYIEKIAALENISKSFSGVAEAYAIQAGREVRVIVIPEEVDDNASLMLARNIKDRIESELNYPGQVKVTVIRETRAVEVAR
ncbi:MAG: ribonuclease Y [Bacillales bacterium]|jgi:ribonuclease Y|nr:ribonuclease Y [Bacillales bacterium]